MSQDVRTIHFPPDLIPEQQDGWLTATFIKCLHMAKKRWPNEHPGIFDRSDMESSTMIGLFDGMCRVEWGRGDGYYYITQSGIWRMRTDRFRALSKKLIIRCAGCGRELKMSENPCHEPDGTPRVVVASGSKKNPKDTMYGQDPRILIEPRIVHMAELGTELIESYGAEDFEDSGF